MPTRDSGCHRRREPSRSSCRSASHGCRLDRTSRVTTWEPSKVAPTRSSSLLLVTLNFSTTQVRIPERFASRSILLPTVELSLDAEAGVVMETLPSVAGAILRRKIESRVVPAVPQHGTNRSVCQLLILGHHELGFAIVQDSKYVECN
jgi:hypothetical protein